MAPSPALGRVRSRWGPVVLVWFLGGCGPTGPVARTETDAAARNVVLVTLDTVRADALGALGGPRGLTPELDALAREAIVFRQARTVAPLTLPAHASMLTGLVPPRHRVRDNGLRALPGTAETLAEHCRAAGIATAAFVSSGVLDAAFGLEQGFDLYAQPARPAPGGVGTYRTRSAEETVAAAVRWLSRRPDEPFLLWVHLYDAHVPYEPPAAYLARAGGDPYLGEVARVDAGVGALLAALRAEALLADTLVLVVGDHGEARGEHGEPTHGALCYDATLRVPLLVRAPGGRGGGRTDDRVASVVDVFPTVLAALGLAVPAGSDGHDLLAPWPAEAGAYCESYSGYLNYGWSPLVGWVDVGGKYLASSCPEFYDLRADPVEAHDLYDRETDAVRPYEDALRRALSAPVLAEDESGGGGAVDLALLAQLRALGYGAYGTELEELPVPWEHGDRPCPRERSGELLPLQRAFSAAAAGRHTEAAELLLRLVEDNPGHVLAEDALGVELMVLGRFRAAREVLERRVERGPVRTDTCVNLGLACERLGDPQAAARWFRRALELDPRLREARAGLARSDAAAAR